MGCVVVPLVEGDGAIAAVVHGCYQRHRPSSIVAWPFAVDRLSAAHTVLHYTAMHTQDHQQPQQLQQQLAADIAAAVGAAVVVVVELPPVVPPIGDSHLRCGPGPEALPP